MIEMLDRNAMPIKIGDRVLYASKSHDFGYGTVLFTAGTFCAVEFDNYCDELNDADGNGKPGHCWFAYPSFLEIAGEQETKISENDLRNFLFTE